MRKIQIRLTNKTWPVYWKEKRNLKKKSKNNFI